MIEPGIHVALRRGVLTVACLLAVAASGRDAGAQQAQAGAPPKSWGQVQFGSLYITPTVALRHVGADTNVYNERAQPKADFTATLVPIVDFDYKAPRLTVSVSPELSLIYYHTFTRERAVNPAVRITADFSPSKRINLFVRSFMGYTRARPNYEIDARVRQRVADLSVSLRYTLGKRIDLSLTGQIDQAFFEQGARFDGVLLENTMNLRRQIASTRIAYKLTPFTAVFGDFGVMAERFPGAPERSADDTYYSGGLRFGRRAAVDGEVAVGRRIRKSLTDLPDVQTTTLRGTLSTNFSDRARFTTSALRNLDYSYSRDTPYYTGQTYSGGLTVAVIGPLDVEGIFVYQGRDYGRFDAPGPGKGSVVEVSRGYRFGLGYRVRRAFRASVYGMFWDRKADRRPGRAYRGWNLGFQFGPVRGNQQGILASEIRP